MKWLASKACRSARILQNRLTKFSFFPLGDAPAISAMVLPFTFSMIKKGLSRTDLSSSRR
ncbi:MAG: hypothetical protein QXF24_06415 [Thermoproteota archaeon]